QIAPFSDSDPAFDLAAGYATQAELTAMRVAAGATVVGAKVGFTNTRIWDQFGIRAPIHAPVFDTTLAAGTVALAGLMEPLIEPEVVLLLGATPTRQMDDAALLACVEAAAPGFEIVHSPYPGWRCRAADFIAAGGMHAALVTGDWVAVDADWVQSLRRFTVSLSCDGVEQDRGSAGNLLGEGPLAVLRHLVGLDTCPVLQPGDLVSTGTVTRALPGAAGQSWRAAFDGLPLVPLDLRLA
ncbi:MAG: fumarylacetoacetate hydrolase family protein, partial [Pararhodobacter sp.]|nr:fumarylacetoacetate hydrolase family protein [Pararhodobacter sp.]